MPFAISIYAEELWFGSTKHSGTFHNKSINTSASWIRGRFHRQRAKAQL